MTKLKVSETIMAAAALLLFVSCASETPATGPVESSNTMPGANGAGFGGRTVFTSATTNATVASLDVAAKKMELRMAGGTVRTYDIDPGVIPREHFKPEASVRVETTEERTVYFGPSSAPPEASPKSATLRLPLGSGSAVKLINTQNYTAKILAINAWQTSVTLQLSNGQTRTIKVRESMNLADVKVGDTVSIQISETTVVMPVTP
jgi:hypothetical protein